MKKHTQKHKSFWASGKGKAVYLLGIVLIFAFVISLYAPEPSPQAKNESPTLIGGHPACLTEELFDQLTQAVSRKDERGWEFLMRNGCIDTKPGIQISILEESSWKCKVRAYVENDAVILWTNRENIKP